MSPHTLSGPTKEDTTVLGDKEAVVNVLPSESPPDSTTTDAESSHSPRLRHLANRLRIEERGIERVPEDERHETGLRALFNVTTLWTSANMTVSTFAVGVLGRTLFFLGAADAMLVVLFFNLLAAISVGFYSTFGPPLGLRQIVLSRFWFGWWGTKLVGVLDIISMVGWAAVNSIVGAQLIHAVNENVPGAVAIVIIALCTLVVCVFGYKIVHAYEFVSWIPAFVVFFIVLGVFAHSGDFQAIPMGTGRAELGSVLSFGAVVYGYSSSWAVYAADYTVYQATSQSRVKVFFFTAIGLLFPLLFVEFLGVAVASATAIDNGDNRYQAGFESAQTGGLLAAVLVYHLETFGKFCLVVLALTTIANNCPNIYSLGIAVQILARDCRKIPRYVWTVIGTGVYIGIAIPGYSHFETVLQSFLDLIGYWVAIYSAIAATDHIVWKRSIAAYNVSLHDKPSALPLGIAAVFSFCVGVVGMVLGMSQEWYVGPIALNAGPAPYGGDVGFELSYLFAIITYLITRPIELKYFGR